MKNKKLIKAILISIALIITLITINVFIEQNKYEDIVKISGKYYNLTFEEPHSIIELTDEKNIKNFMNNLNEAEVTGKMTFQEFYTNYPYNLKITYKDKEESFILILDEEEPSFYYKEPIPGIEVDEYKIPRKNAEKLIQIFENNNKEDK